MRKRERNRVEPCESRALLSLGPGDLLGGASEAVGGFLDDDEEGDDDGLLDLMSDLLG